MELLGPSPLAAELSRRHRCPKNSQHVIGHLKQDCSTAIAVFLEMSLSFHPSGMSMCEVNSNARSHISATKYRHPLTSLTYCFPRKLASSYNDGAYPIPLWGYRDCCSATVR